LVWEACEYGCGLRFFKKELREAHEREDSCPRKRTPTKTKQPQHEALAVLWKEILACFDGTREPSVVTKRLKRVLLYESGEAKFDSLNAKNSKFTLPGNSNVQSNLK
jgi:hypothetical protein